MATLKELRQVRIDKLQKLKELGVNPYPPNSERTHKIGQILRDFAENENKKCVVVGYIISVRSHGKLTFIDLKDFSGQIQLYIKQETLSNANYNKGELNFEDIELLDIGDYVEAHGVVTKSKSGQESIEINKLRLLTKSLRPLPDKWDGLKDKETRMRRRYVDTKINDEVRYRYERRAKFWQATREFLNNNGFLEINIPVLESIPGGADAKPFVTHMDAIDEDFYLRISHELYLKRLIGGGYEKVYEIGPRFRNEGYSDEHLPEHIAMEFYWAYASWEDGMKFIQELFSHVIQEVYGDKKVFNIRGFEVDFSKEWEILDFEKVIKDRFNIDIYSVSLEELAKVCEAEGLSVDSYQNKPRAIDNLWKILRKEIAGPAFLINHPKFLSPLAKAHEDNPEITERFQPIIAGSELGNGWSEITDPQDQLQRFLEQEELREEGDDEAQWLDIDYVEMLEYGMPPTFGWGHAERLFWFLEDVPAREGVPFPQLKHHISDNTREIYGLTFGDSKEPTLNNKSSNISDDLSGLPSREEALELLNKHVADDYQKLHAKMVAEGLSAYAKKVGENEDLWYITGLLHDLDYFSYPDEHPKMALNWFAEWGYPEQLIHAVTAHAHDRLGVLPQTQLAAALCAVDEMAGFLYAYSLMRPEGFDGMKAKSVKKKFKDKSFAAKISRDDINFGIEQFDVDFSDHVDFLIEVYLSMFNSDDS